MIRVEITLDPGDGGPSRSIGRMEIARVDGEPPSCDYSVNVALDRDGEAVLHTRTIRGFNPGQWNALMLVQRAIFEIGWNELRREPGDSQHDLSR